MTGAQAAFVASRSGSGGGRGHIPALDGYRGVAILLVLTYHLLPAAPGASSLFRLFYAVTRYGSYGVDLFFVLSGFLITGILLDTKGEQRRFTKFYARRTLRIFPLYFGVLIVLFGVLAPLGWYDTPPLQRILRGQYWLWLYAANVPISFTGTWYFNAGWLNISHVWSLAVEEHYYLCWPMVVYCFRKRTAFAVCVGLIVISCVCRSIFKAHDLYLGTWTFTFCRCDELAIGSAAAILARSNARHYLTAKATVVCALASFACLTLMTLLRADQGIGAMVILSARYLTMGLFSASSIVSAALFPKGIFANVVNARILRVLGKYSYGLYVYHVLLLYFCTQYVGREVYRLVHLPATAALLVFLASSSISFAAAYLSWHLYEKQFLKLKKFFEYRHSQASGAIRSETKHLRASAAFVGEPTK